MGEGGGEGGEVSVGEGGGQVGRDGEDVVDDVDGAAGEVEVLDAHTVLGLGGAVGWMGRNLRRTGLWTVRRCQSR